MSIGAVKPLGAKAYGSIGHLPESRQGPGDHHVTPGQARICTKQPRDKHDRVIVQEKLDGACVAVAKVKGDILALGRAGYLADKSPYVHHHLFAWWVRREAKRFAALLLEGERVAGEWLALAHGTRYDLPHEPFVAFDIITGAGPKARRATWAEVEDRVRAYDFTPPMVLGYGCMPAVVAMGMLDKPLGVTTPYGYHGAHDPVEGAVWRVERREPDGVDFLAKYVRPEKADGIYLAEVSGRPPVWNDWPDKRTFPGLGVWP